MRNGLIIDCFAGHGKKTGGSKLRIPESRGTDAEHEDR